MFQSSVYDCCDSYEGDGLIHEGCPLTCEEFPQSSVDFATCCNKYPNSLGCGPYSTGLRTDCQAYDTIEGYNECCKFEGNQGCNVPYGAG
jgi:hypothetical protein